MSEHLRKFFAVTRNSVYRVKAYGEKDCPYIERIAATLGCTGTRYNDASMLAIARTLQFYFPEGHSMLSPQTSEERRLEHVNTAWWRTSTSWIVALFLTEEEALACFERPELKPCDPRWIGKTREVVEKIGEDHPKVTICHYPELSLLPLFS
ncbi:MAG: hypothetical protein WC470_01100 [Candidatus Paceibacterota bacterium]